MWARLSRRERVLLVLAAAVLAVFTGYRYLWTGLAAQWNGTLDELSQVREQLAAAQAAQANLPREEELLAAAREAYRKSRSGFAHDVTDGGAVVRLGMAAIEEKVAVTGYHAMGLATAEHYLALPVILELRGSYPGVLALLARIEGRRDIPALVDVRRLAVEQSRDPAEAAAGIVEGRLTLVFYAEPTAAGRMALAEIAGWKVGRPDSFAPAGRESPYPGVFAAPPPAASRGETTGPAVQDEERPEPEPSP